VSDGVQSLITEQVPGTIFCRSRRAATARVNFYSRVQMYLFKARLAAQEELKKAYEAAGVTEAQVRDFLAKHPEYASPLYHAPHTAAGSAANLVNEIAPLITMTRSERAAKRAKAAGTELAAVVTSAPAKVGSLVAWAKDPETQERLRADAEVFGELGAWQGQGAFRSARGAPRGQGLLREQPRGAPRDQPRRRELRDRRRGVIVFDRR
jgi:hypothetical protein